MNGKTTLFPLVRDLLLVHQWLCLLKKNVNRVLFLGFIAFVDKLYLSFRIRLHGSVVKLSLSQEHYRKAILVKVYGIRWCTLLGRLVCKVLCITEVR